MGWGGMTRGLPQLFFAFKFLWLFGAALAYKLAGNARGIAMPVLINGGLYGHFSCG